MEFIKETSRGHRFNAEYSVTETQIQKAFKAFLDGRAPVYILEEFDVLRSNIHEWDDYFWIDATRNLNDGDQLRNLKTAAIQEFVNIFDQWQQSKNTFEEDVALEIKDAGRLHMQAYVNYLNGLLKGDVAIILNPPVIHSMLTWFQSDTPPEEQYKQVCSFFASEHFANISHQLLQARMFAAIKDKVKRGAYSNREEALGRLNGLFYDMGHIATYAPYCDGFIMDQPMASLVSDPRVGLEKKYGVKVFSLNNWDELFKWFDDLEAGMRAEHRCAVSRAYC